MFNVDNLKLRGFTVNNYNQINTLEFSYPYKDVIDVLKDNDCPDVLDIYKAKGRKRNVSIQFTLDDVEIINTSLLSNIDNCVSPEVYDIDLDYLVSSEEELSDLEERINYIIDNKDILLEGINTVNQEIENTRFSNYTSGFEISNDENVIDKYTKGKKADELPDLDDYDGNFEDDYYDR